MQILSIPGSSNSCSLESALSRLGYLPRRVLDPSQIHKKLPLILPGVGQFLQAMQYLNASGAADIVRSHGGLEAPIIGICLGMQLLFQSGSEGSKSGVPGLGLLTGEVVPFHDFGRGLNIGWRSVQLPDENSQGVGYFAHSQFAKTSENILSTGKNGDLNFPTIVGRDSIMGFQFHPEISGDFGLACLTFALK